MRSIWPRLALAVLVLLAAALLVRGEPQKEPPIAPLVMERGAMVIAVLPDSAAEAAGLEVGDVIMSVNGVVITSESVLNSALKFSTVVRMEVMKRDEGRRVRILAFTKDGELGALVVMVNPETAPFFPKYRRWI
jgi:S1-C subfamily serine protease